MKPNTITKTNFQTISANQNRDSLKTGNSDNPFSFQDFTVPLQMTHQEIKPPAYVWDRIASVLDEQDRLKALSQNENIATPVIENYENDRRFIWYAAVVMIVGTIVVQFI